MPENVTSSTNEQAALHAKMVEEAMSDPNIPKLYVNGFINGLTQADVVILLQRNGQGIGILNMSFTVAKTFAQKVAKSIGVLEARTKTTIMTMEETAMERNGDATD